MIEAKGTREAAKSATAAHDCYQPKEAVQRTRLPWAFGLFLVGLVTYLKASLFGSTSAAADDQADDDQNAPPPTGDPTAAALAALAPSAIAEPTPPAPFTLVDSSVFNYSDGAGSSAALLPGEAQVFRPPANRDTGHTAGGSASVLPFPPHKAAQAAAQNSSQSATSSGGGWSGGGGRDGGGSNGGGSGGAGDTGTALSYEDPAGLDIGAPRPGKQADKNRAPRISAPVYLNDVGSAAVLIAVSDLLRNASDPDGDALSLRNVTVSSGTLTQEVGGWLYTPETGALGDVLVTYEITDGAVAIQQFAHFAVVPAPVIMGTAADDNLLGTLLADDIDAGSGDDNIDAQSGNDVIGGGSGSDHIIAGAGNDVVYAGTGDDVVFGGTGNDTIFGGGGDDRLLGEEGNDTLFGEEGDDIVLGGAGNDLLFGGDGSDNVKGDDGRDVIHGGLGNDTLDGGAADDILFAEAGDDVAEGGDGNDVLSDGEGSDNVSGGPGNDYLLVSIDTATDHYEGGDGVDTLDLSATRISVQVDLQSGTADGEQIGINFVSGIEEVIGGAGNDILSGSSREETLIGGAGDDRLCAAAGSDTIEGGSGCDLIIASLDSANDSYDGGADCDTLDLSMATMHIEVDFAAGEARGEEIGVDSIQNLEKVLGGQGDDLFVAGNKGVVFSGGAGADTFVFNALVTSADVSEVVHEILDFMVGDRVRIEAFELFEPQSQDDRFVQLYGDGSDQEGQIRLRHDNLADLERTIIEADLNDDDHYEISITLIGHHSMSLHEYAS